VDVSTLADGTLKLLGALFRRVGERAADMATVSMAQGAARLIRKRLPPDHWLAKVLERAEHEGSDEAPPDGLREELLRLLREQPDLQDELAPFVGNLVINIDKLNQQAEVANVGAGKFVIVGPLANPPPPPADEASIISAVNRGPEHASIIQIANFASVGPVEIVVPPRPMEPARQLDAVRGFVGRKVEVARLRRLLRYRSGSAPLAIVSGPPGVGKTDLAQYVANQLADRDYPDLQLLVRLSDGQASRPAGPAEVLRDLLLALDVPAGNVPDDLTERGNQYRSALSGKRALILLDGATSDGQVRPLLPPTGCATVVTTRNALIGVRAKGTELPLSPLASREALALLALRLRWLRVVRQPYGAIKLVTACDGLPLALSIVAAQLASPFGRRTRLRDAAHLLRHQAGRAVPGQRALAGAFAVSYLSLPAEERRTFQYLGLLNVPKVETAVVAATAAVDDEEAERLLAILANANLLEATARPGHWRMRALVLDYARSRADVDLTGQSRKDAATRAIEFQLRRVRRLRARIDAVARIDPAEAARLQAELSEEHARGAAVVDRAVGYKLDLLGLVSDELVDALFDLLTAWPNPSRAREAMRAVLKRAGQGEASEVEARAREWLESQPDPPPADGGGPQRVHAPTRQEIRAQFAPYLRADTDPRALQAEDRFQGLDQEERSLGVEGWGFNPGEGIQISVDGVASGRTTADESGTFVTTVWFFSPSDRPRVVVIGDLSGPVDPS
jgi:Mrp family chromosome partitioning ATPase